MVLGISAILALTTVSIKSMIIRRNRVATTAWTTRLQRWTRLNERSVVNRSDRIIGILLVLQGGSRTAAELATRFEVTRRTILRDIEALGELAVPVVT